jgi:hypothetical protein
VRHVSVRGRRGLRRADRQRHARWATGPGKLPAHRPVHDQQHPGDPVPRRGRQPLGGRLGRRLERDRPRRTGGGGRPDGGHLREHGHRILRRPER